MDVGAAAHVFVPDLSTVELSDDDRHHLARVLRLRPGEAVTASDGAGQWRSCSWTGTGLEPAGEVVTDDQPAPPITIAFAVPKSDRPEWIVQKLTELGVDRIVLLHTARSVVRWEGDRAIRQVDRLRRVVREAAMQSRRAWLPAVDGVTTIGELATEVGGAMALAERGGPPPTLDTPMVAVGPEGGWNDAERDGRACVGLADNVLRVETAAIAAGILLCARRSGLL